jgi:hypothetical protein
VSQKQNKMKNKGEEKRKNGAVHPVLPRFEYQMTFS